MPGKPLPLNLPDDVPIPPALAFGIVLRELRQMLGLSQNDLEHDLELNQSYISKIEHGQREPSFSHILILAKKLGVAPEELVRLAAQRVRE